MAAEQALSNRLLDVTIDGARGILFNVTGGPDLSLYEINQAASIIRETAHPDVNLIFGAVVDEEMGDEIRITVIATGFEHTLPSMHRMMPRPTERSVPQRPPVREPAPVSSERERPAPASASSNSPSSASSAQDRSSSFRLDDLEIPAFLRKKR